MWYNVNVKKLSTIGICFCLFISILVAALFWMPDSWRIHPRLKIPDIVFLCFQPPQKILTVGDSFAVLAPWPVAKRICCGGIRVTRITEVVQERAVDNSITDILLLAGVASWFYHDKSLSEIEGDISVLEAALTQKYPNAIIIKVSISEMLQCVKEYPRDNDKLHLSPAGYEILRQRHFPHLTF